jgi:hypothetical protein
MRPRASSTIVTSHPLVRILGVRLDVLLEVLRSLEGLAAHFTFMRLQWDMHTNMRRDVITLHRGGIAVTPRTHKIQVVRGLAADVLLTDMILTPSARRWRTPSARIHTYNASGLG